jgi:transcriptional regulator with XRE-family HTH domain
LTAEQRDEGKRLAKQLRQARQDADQAQSELAARAAVSLDFVRALEGGRVSTPSFSSVARLARELKIGLDSLAREVLPPR